MPTEPCRHAHGEILLCSRCLMGRADHVDEKGAAISPLPVAGSPVLEAPRRARGPSKRQGKLVKARKALQVILKRDGRA